MEKDKLKTEELFTKEDLEKAFDAGRECYNQITWVDDEEELYYYDTFKQWFEDKNK